MNATDNDPGLPHILLVKTAFGLESIVARELKDLGYTNLVVEDGEIRFRGDNDDVAVCNIGLRCAERVLIELSRFDAKDFDQLFEGIRQVTWEDILTKDGQFPITVDLVRSTIDSVRSAQSIAKKAVIECLQRKYQVARFPETGVEFPIEVSIRNDRCSVSINTSGDGLHKRGYRQSSGLAPLRETVAAALVILSAWDRSMPLLDPFCGSGTILIEAALIASSRAPGLDRKFAAERWPAFENSIFGVVRERFTAAIKKPEVELWGADRSNVVLLAAGENLKRARVKAVLETRDFLSRPPQLSRPCQLISNLPYGMRVGTETEVQQIYRAVGRLMKSTFQDRRWTGCFGFLTPDRSFQGAVGREANQKRKLYNANIRVDYYTFRSTSDSDPM